MQNETESVEVVRLPMWKSCLEKMRGDGVEYGRTYPAEFFEQFLKCARDSMCFGLALAEIRRELESDGFYLSGRGQKGNQFIVLPPASNSSVMASYQRQAIDSLKRGVILGTNTRLDLLNPSERKRHEGMLEKMAVRTVLIQRSTQIYKAIQKSDPKLLQL